MLAILSIALLSAKRSVVGDRLSKAVHWMFSGGDLGDIVRGGLAWTEVSEGDVGGDGGGRVL